MKLILVLLILPLYGMSQVKVSIKNSTDRNLSVVLTSHTNKQMILIPGRSGVIGISAMLKQEPLLIKWGNRNIETLTLTRKHIVTHGLISIDLYMDEGGVQCSLTEELWRPN